MVTTAARRHVAIDDPLPGGFVAIDPTLRTGLEESSGQVWNHRELRADRVLFFIDALPAGISTFTYWAKARTAGDFVLPAAHAHEMYAPHTRGATAPSRVTVIRR